MRKTATARACDPAFLSATGCGFGCAARVELADCGGRIVKTLHLYLTRQIVIALLMTVAVFTLVFLLGNLLNEILALLVKGHASPGIVLEAMGLLIPFVMVFALPMALLAATLLVFSRFSADQELTAARAGGISLLWLVTPVLVLSLCLCALCAWVNLELGPRSRVAYKDLIFKFQAQVTPAILPEGRFIKDFKDAIIYVGRNDGDRLQNVMVALLESGTNTAIFRAARGEISQDLTNRELVLELIDMKAIRSEGGRDIVGYSSRFPLKLKLGESPGGPKKPRISDLTFQQLRDELREVEETLWRTAPLAGLTPEEMKQRKADLQKQVSDLTSPLRVQLHRQVAFSFACFGFTLIGIPLGIRVHRRETNVSFAIALGLVAVYYGFLLVGNALAARPEFSPHLIVWLPNFVFQAAGTVLLWRANKGV